jgi:fructose-specific phosphotransferase system IIA component
MKLKDLLSKDIIRIPLENQEKSKIIEELVEILYESNRISDKEAVLKAVLDREAVMSTGMGDGVAIPHAKSDSVDGLIAAFGITSEPVDFESIDGKPVRMIFLLVGPTDQTGPHLKALSRISRLMHREDFRQKLAVSQTSDQVIEAIEAEEKKYFAI